MNKYTYTDISGDIGELYCSNETPKCPMYSYSRPAYTFWQGFYDGLRKKGASHDDALAVLRSKAARHMLDGNDDKLNKLGENLAKKGFKNWMTYISTLD